MNWWKLARIENFDDRNDVNLRIKKLIALAELLKYCAKLVYQTQRGAKALASNVASNKTLSSFPEVLDILTKADKVAMDNPQTFGDYCKEAAKILDEKRVDLEDEREEFTQDKLPKRMKGIVDE